MMTISKKGSTWARMFDGHVQTRSSRDREREMVIQKKVTDMQETDIE